MLLGPSISKILMTRLSCFSVTNFIFIVEDETLSSPQYRFVLSIPCQEKDRALECRSLCLPFVIKRWRRIRSAISCDYPTLTANCWDAVFCCFFHFLLNFSLTFNIHFLCFCYYNIFFVLLCFVLYLFILFCPCHVQGIIIIIWRYSPT